MALQIDDKMVGLWYLLLDGRSDYMLGLSRTDDPGRFRIEYRFRYYLDEKAHDSKDKRSWYAGTVKASEGEAIEKLRSMVGVLALASGNAPTEILMRDCGGDVEKFMKTLAAQPFAHVEVRKIQ